MERQTDISLVAKTALHKCSMVKTSPYNQMLLHISSALIFVFIISQDAKIALFRCPVTPDCAFFGVGMPKFGIPT